MTDILSPAQRSAQMSRIRGKDTTPERTLRSHLSRLGVRYRLHGTGIIGRPDISHKGARLAVFVDGCFWHGCPRHYRPPSNRAGFWKAKLKSNLERRQVVKWQLTQEGWRVIEVWECDIEETAEAIALRISREIGRERYRISWPRETQAPRSRIG